MFAAQAPVRLNAERHYESLRDAVWLRVVAEDPRMPWAAFEDAYQEAWAWVTARERAGSAVTVDAGSPVAYLAQVVRRRYVDELRARRRGVGRDGEAPVIELLDDHAERVAARGTDDGDDATEARRAVSAIFLLARERLTARELQAFALSYVLEMPPRDAAAAMGVSAKRFRNLRWDGWRKVGDEVVSLLEGRLQWCASEEAAALRARAIAGDPQSAGPFRVHLACCAACSHSVASARRAAAAVLPLPMVLGAGRDPGLERLLGAFEGAWETVWGRASRPLLRLAEWTAAAPPNGRVAAVAVAIAASAGGGVALEGESAAVAPGAAAAALDRAPLRQVSADQRLLRLPVGSEPGDRPEPGGRPGRAAQREREAPRRSSSAAPAAPPVAAAPPVPAPLTPVPVAPATPDPGGEFGFE